MSLLARRRAGHGHAPVRPDHPLRHGLQTAADAGGLPPRCPSIRAHKRWFVTAALLNLLVCTEAKNLVNRVAHLKQLRGEHQWVVTPRTAPSTGSTLAWLGGLGYGIYLIHEPVLRLMNHWGVLPDPQQGSVFVATAVLVAVPTIVLAWISSRTVEAAGLRLATLIDRDGKKRDYYPHLARDAA